MRAAIILFDGGSVALIERIRDGRQYYLFPGGQVGPDETPEDAAEREALEELGLDVEITRLVARGRFGGSEQRYYLARKIGGVFGAGEGDEMTGAGVAGAGSYRPVLWPIGALATIELRPAGLAGRIERAAATGWPDEVAEISD